MNRPLVYWGVAALAAAVVIGVVVFFQLPSPNTPPSQAQAPAAEPSTSPSPAPANGAAPTSTTSASTTSTGAAPSPGTIGTGAPQTAALTPGVAIAPMAPEFDIVRVDDNGNVVIAGRATPDCTITVRDGDAIVGAATVDRRGDWVVVPDEALKPGDRELNLIANCGDSDPVESDRVVVLAVPQPAQGVGALAVAVARDGSAPTQVLQTPAGGQPGPGGTGADVAVAAVDYNDAGAVALSGTAPPGSTVQIYVDNELIGRTKADAQGRWSLIPDRRVDPGSYTLRVDQVTPQGQVVARSQIPFVRGEPLTDLPEGRVVIIQPGDYLWQIARERYGAGPQYTLIYEANRAQIRDPDLIYPGQIFMVPTVN
ncbi:MAG: LysM peptidoglycan-binding domain-containing protein [Alphaproteobacteria bacterium]|nr:LysM peptidoglycan-binding domain-containing protein [Alphaproteobacteria bacterium]